MLLERDTDDRLGGLRRPAGSALEEAAKRASRSRKEWVRLQQLKTWLM